MRKLLWGSIFVAVAGLSLATWVVREPSARVEVGLLEEAAPAPSAQVSTPAGRLAESADPSLIAAARATLGPDGRLESCGPYQLLTDVEDPRLEAACEHLAGRLDAVYAERLGLEPLGEPAETVVVFAEIGDFRNFAHMSGLRSGYAGFALGARGIAVFHAQVEPFATFLSTFAHELSHLVSRRALGSDLPPWLSEGLADALGDSATEAGFEPLPPGPGGGAQAERLRQAYADGRALGLERLVSLEHGDFDREVVSFDYEQSALLVRFLLTERELAPRLRAYLARLAAGEAYGAESFRGALGVAWSELERRFRRWLGVAGGERGGGGAIDRREG